MSINEKTSGADAKESYSSPELVRLGDAMQITQGPGGTFADSPPKPGGAGFYDIPETASPNPERFSGTPDSSPDSST